MPPDTQRYLYFDADLRRAAPIAHEALAATTERHHLALVRPELSPVADPRVELDRTAATGAVLEQTSGLPTAPQLALLAALLGGGRRAWLYWPSERAVECVDAERLRSFTRHVRAVAWMKRLGGPLGRASAIRQRVAPGLRWIYRGAFPVRRSDIATYLDRLIVDASPVPIEPARSGGVRLPLTGVYLRADFWPQPEDGCRAAKTVRELAAAGSRVVCLTARPDETLDAAGIPLTVVMDAPSQTAGQDAVVLAPAHYRRLIKVACRTQPAAYLYERLVAGGYAGAEISQSLRLPYIVEYPGLDAMLAEALGDAPQQYAELYARAEELALRQATIVVVRDASLADAIVSRGIDASRVIVDADDGRLGDRLADRMQALALATGRAERIETGDAYKEQVQAQWDHNPVGSHHARESQPHTLEWFLEVERHRYGTYAPWMPETMEMSRHAGQQVLEIGGGMGTDLAQFAAHGAVVTDSILSAGHLRLAEENFRLRGFEGRFIHHDGESLPFADASFDVVYSNGVLHHTPNTVAVVKEIHRVLRPGGRAIVMVYAERSLHYWRNLVWSIGVRDGSLDRMSMGEIMSRSVERTANEARPLVKVYSRPRLLAMFRDFDDVEIVQRQLLAEELPGALRWALPAGERLLGWNLIVKGTKR